MQISTNDKLNKYLDSASELAQYTQMFSWKFKCIKALDSITFVKISESQYILAIDNLSDQCQVVGIWDTKDQVGITCIENIKGLLNSTLLLIPTTELNNSNVSLFNKGKSTNQVLEDQAFEILCRLMTHSAFQNRSNKEIAIKSLQLAMEFRSNLTDVLSLLSSMEEKTS